MKRKIIIGIIVSTLILFRLGFWSFLRGQYAQYKAVKAYKDGDKEPAKEFYSSRLVDNPHDGQLNYNAGVVQYRQKKYEEARDSFVRAAKSSDTQLKEQAYFNLGNTLVALEKLEEALKAYEDTLEINPENEYAKHNLALVQEMLRKKKEQEQQEQQKQQQNKDQKQQEQKQSSEQEQKQDNAQEQSGNQSDKSGEKQQDAKDKKDQQDKAEQDKDSDESQQKKNDQGQKSGQQKQQSQKNEKGSQPNEPTQEERSSEKQENAGNDGQQKEQESQQQGNGQKRAEHAKEEQGNPVLQEQLQAARKLEEKLDRELLAVLQEAEKQDEGEYKKMIKSHVKKEMPRHEGQKNW